MKSQVKFFLVALAMIGLCIGFMTAAQAESMYVGWVSTATSAKTSVVKAYSTTTYADQGLSFSGFDYTNHYIQDIAVSPTSGNVFVSVYNTKSGGYHRIVEFDDETGACVNDNVYSSTSSTNVVRGICFDSTGNMYFSLGNRKIAKVSYATGLTDLNWGNATDTAYTIGSYASDLEVRDGYLYAAVCAYSTANIKVGAVVRYALSGETGVAPVQITADIADARAYALTFGPDGTLYTTDDTNKKVGKWTLNTTTNIYDTYTTITPEGCLNPQDIDYFDGALYIIDKQEPRMVRKYDLTATTPSWSDIVQYPASGSATGWTHGWMAFSSTVVPEPGTLVLLACGLVGLLAHAWRKRR